MDTILSGYWLDMEASKRVIFNWELDFYKQVTKCHPQTNTLWNQLFCNIVISKHKERLALTTLKWSIHASYSRHHRKWYPVTNRSRYIGRMSAQFGLLLLRCPVCSMKMDTDSFLPSRPWTCTLTDRLCVLPDLSKKFSIRISALRTTDCLEKWSMWIQKWGLLADWNTGEIYKGVLSSQDVRHRTLSR